MIISSSNRTISLNKYSSAISIAVFFVLKDRQKKIPLRTQCSCYLLEFSSDGRAVKCLVAHLLMTKLNSMTGATRSNAIVRQTIIAEGQNFIIPYMGPKSRPGMKGIPSQSHPSANAGIEKKR